MVGINGFSSSNYRYSFQGQETDDEIKGKGNSVNYKYRMHDPRIGRFFAVDPLAPEYPWYTPYQFSGNKVISCIELEGLEEHNIILEDGSTQTVNGPFRLDYIEQVAIDMGGHVEGTGTSPTVGTDPWGTIEYGGVGFWLMYNATVQTHTHNSVINSVYESTYGDALYRQHASGGEVRALSGDLKLNLSKMANGSSAQKFNLYTNTNRAYFVSDGTFSTEIAFINWMLGAFINGDGHENYVFSEGSPFSQHVRNTATVERAIEEWKSQGMPNGLVYGSYGFKGQAGGIFRDGTLLTIENFIGSANVFFKKISDTEVEVTVINITSLTSGDLGKHFPWHIDYPVSNIRGTGASAVPQPYSNISQIFNFTISIP